MPRREDKIRRQNRWFSRGVAALAAFRAATGSTIGSTPGTYPCPLCLGELDRASIEDGRLTDEHVPPGALGGDRLVLTCDGCNNRSGSELDAHAIREELLLSFAQGRDMRRPVDVTLKIGDTTTRSSVQVVDRCVFVKTNVKNNFRAYVDASTKTLESWAGPQGLARKFDVKFRDTFVQQRANISWLRSAYLAGFAALGWRFILRQVMQPIRDQIAQPDSNHSLPVVGLDFSAGQDVRRLFWITEPRAIRSFAVTIGQRTVFLPDLNEPLSRDELSDGNRQSKGNFVASGEEFPWPTWPGHLLDQDL
jgi:hypothetical protein